MFLRVGRFKSIGAMSVVSAEQPGTPSGWLVRRFRSYAVRYVRRHFHAIRIAIEGSQPTLPPGPVMVMLNHASWWDPLVGLILSGLWGEDRVHYAVIEAGGLSQYPFLARLGFLGVETGTVEGAKRFLRQSLAILDRRNTVLWITPQGRFTDPRARPLKFQAGLGVLVHKLPRVSIIPLALEYPFWNDRLPEILVWLGDPITKAGPSEQSAGAWTHLLETALEHCQDRLSCAAQARDPALFHTLVSGMAGVGGIYDQWRRLKALLAGRLFVAEHQTAQRPSASRAATRSRTSAQL